MKISNLVSAYVQSLAARKVEASQLQEKIARLESRLASSQSERIASRLRLAQHELNSLDSKHRGAVSWVTSVATPLYEILGKVLGRGYTGTICSAQFPSVRITYSCIDSNLMVEGVKRVAVYLTPMNSPAVGMEEMFDLQIQRALVTIGSTGEASVDSVPLDLPVRRLVMA